MSNTVIKVENLGKQYRLGEVGTGTLSHDLNRWWSRVRGKEDPFAKIGEVNDRTLKSESEYVWALKDINFDVKAGDVLGIIGRNGAGKSTLLKILAKVTKPTKGRILTRGRIASLLEVGTGFHPEMTGRENVYLNGAIMGMTRADIRQKFDEIVDFAGVERYIDTPVKRYSSGMYVRLAFAVAAHLEPEILVVDEVLAVGDADFQKKAIGKMQNVSTDLGRTVLFVSHNMAAVKALCNVGTVLHNGGISYYGQDIDSVVDSYLASTSIGEERVDINLRKDRKGNGIIKVTELRLLNTTSGGALELGKPICIQIILSPKIKNVQSTLLVSINNMDEQCILFLDSRTQQKYQSVINDDIMITITLPGDFALPLGKYYINVAVLANNDMSDHVQRALVFNIIEGKLFDNGKLPSGKSICYIKEEWEVKVV
jgi:lipopolysaccharide transport system ATP-binding protein